MDEKGNIIDILSIKIIKLYNNKFYTNQFENLSEMEKFLAKIQQKNTDTRKYKILIFKYIIKINI